MTDLQALIAELKSDFPLITAFEDHFQTFNSYLDAQFPGLDYQRRRDILVRKFTALSRNLRKESPESSPGPVPEPSSPQATTEPLPESSTEKEPQAQDQIETKESLSLPPHDHVDEQPRADDYAESKEPEFEEDAPAASPQAEDGHIDIANEIAAALARTNLSAYESRILWALWRKTYGWHKKTDQISFTQFEKATGMKRRHVQRTLDELAKRNIVTRIGYGRYEFARGNRVTRIGYGRIVTYGFQKDYTKWRDITKRGYNRPPENPTSYPKGVIYPKGVTDRNPNRLTQKKLTKEIYVEGSEPLRLTVSLLTEIQKNKADFKLPNLQAWAREIDLLLRSDGRRPERIAEVIRWCQQDSFWRANILSTKKLREQFDKLEMKMESTNARKPKSTW